MKVNKAKLLLLLVAGIAITVIITVITISACNTKDEKENKTDTLPMETVPITNQEDTIKSVICTYISTETKPIPNEAHFSADEAEAIAKVLYRECRGVKSKAEKAAVVWCICNRVDSNERYFPDTVMEVITQKNAFAYIEDTPVWPELLDIAEDVLTRWHYEKAGMKDVGRTLPKEYVYFVGNKEQTHNLFTTEWCGTDYWNWSLSNPYAN